jgi:hypothetical protein
MKKVILLPNSTAEYSKMKFICILLVITLYFEVESRRIIESQDNNTIYDKTRYKRKVVSDFLYLWQMPINYMLDDSLSIREIIISKL